MLSLNFRYPCKLTYIYENIFLFFRTTTPNTRTQKSKQIAASCLFVSFYVHASNIDQLQNEDIISTVCEVGKIKQKRSELPTITSQEFVPFAHPACFAE